MRLSLYQPDIAQNVGSIMRLCACFGVALDIIEPCGFPFNMQAVKRSAMDYAEQLAMARHASWEAFMAQKPADARLVLLTTKAELPHYRFSFQPSDIVLMGRESAGVPEDVHNAADARILIPMRPETRSLNIAQAAAIGLAEALRQTDGYP